MLKSDIIHTQVKNVNIGKIFLHNIMILIIIYDQNIIH